MNFLRTFPSLWFVFAFAFVSVNAREFRTILSLQYLFNLVVQSNMSFMPAFHHVHTVACVSLCLFLSFFRVHFLTASTSIQLHLHVFQCFCLDKCWREMSEEKTQQQQQQQQIKDVLICSFFDSFVFFFWNQFNKREKNQGNGMSPRTHTHTHTVHLFCCVSCLISKNSYAIIMISTLFSALHSDRYHHSHAVIFKIPSAFSSNLFLFRTFSLGSHQSHVLDVW